MRSIVVGTTLLATLLAPSIAMANPVSRPLAHIILFEPSDTRGDVPAVAPGDEISIDFVCPNMATPASDVRVVFALDPVPGEEPTGYAKLLATRERFEHGSLRVTIPDAPDLINHTVSVTVYVLGAKGARTIDAGKVRIT